MKRRPSFIKAFEKTSGVLKALGGGSALMGVANIGLTGLGALSENKANLRKMKAARTPGAYPMGVPARV